MKGLISDVECEFLRENGRGVVVEVGCLGGLSTSCLAQRAEVVHCFDTFKLEEPNVAYARALGLPDDFTGDFRHVFYRNTEPVWERLVVHAGDAGVGDWYEPVDVLFLDCSSGWELHRNLYRRFYRHVKLGGLLVHQDFFYNRSPYLAPMMGLLSRCFVPVQNVDTSMVYRRNGEPLPDEVEVDVASQMPVEIERFGGITDPAGAILATALIYWLRAEGKWREADQWALKLMHQHRAGRVWSNLREAYS